MQFIQFGFIEESLQIPFLAVCGLVWTFIISLFAGNAKKSYSEEDANLSHTKITTTTKETEHVVSKAKLNTTKKEKELVLR